MVLATVLVVGATAYLSQQQKENVEPAFDTNDKEVVNLLPHESAVAVLEPPISMLFFYNGNYKVACKYLKQRIQAIIEVNPWLAGWIHTTDGVVQIWYDPKAKDVAPGIFTAFQPGEIPVAQEMPYQEYNSTLNDCTKVKTNVELLGSNEPFFRVCLIPDAKDPNNRFAMTVSISHAAGEAHSFFQVCNMLDPSQPIVKLNPVRLQDFAERIKEKMGTKGESTWLRDMASDSLWQQWTSETCEKQIFIISQEWLIEQKSLWKPTFRNKMTRWMKQVKTKTTEQTTTATEKYNCCWDALFPCSPHANAIVDTPDQAEEELLNESGLTDNDVLVSWFWRACDATVGLMAYNFRNRLDGLTDVDMGNYQNPIPYTAQDYKTPYMIHESVKTGRRVGANRLLNPTVLPDAASTKRISCSANWSTSQSVEIMVEGATKLHLQLPLYVGNAFKAFPSNISLLIIFSAGGGRLGAMCIAPHAMMTKLQTSGMIDDSIAQMK